MSTRDGNTEVYVMNADGSGLRNLSNNPAIDHRGPWSPDGTKILDWHWSDDSLGEIYVLNADGSALRNLSNSPANDYTPVWSPDGTRIAFVSTRDPFGIYEANADRSGLTWLAVGSDPAWGPQ